MRRPRADDRRPQVEPARLQEFGNDILNRRPRACETPTLVLIAERIPSLALRRTEQNAPSDRLGEHVE
ncbi:hypothetical protein [Okibacterium fritillariae]|uniref:hypothetical protein n=1 Tax=Okibacterium fritillariae TaxID=123320 RepID=UPI0009A89A6C|nr:hypothetical protein [Okibacterium fritillariae]